MAKAGTRNALIVGRLEALKARQDLRRERLRPSRLPSAAMQARAAKMAEMAAKMAEMAARWEARRERESLSKQAREIAGHLCLVAIGRRRAGSRPKGRAWAQEVMAASLHRIVAGAAEGLPPRTAETGRIIRRLERAEALLLRLVGRWADQEAAKDAEARKGHAGGG